MPDARTTATRAAALLAALLLPLLALTGTAPAHAAPTLAACPTGWVNAHFSPGLTTESRPTSVDTEGMLGPCLSVGNPAITAARFTTHGTGMASCTAAAFDTTAVVDWNAGPDSVIDYHITVNLKPAGESVLVAEGEVVEGQFAGATVLRVATGLQPSVTGCLTAEGVTESSGPHALAVVD
ncbi:hypothetical protein GCM10027168_32700 [Streptomyces capparidis]